MIIDGGCLVVYLCKYTSTGDVGPCGDCIGQQLKLWLDGYASIC